jgi:hypothetical protein
MTIQYLGSIGEFLGSAGVLATLIYLSVQVRSAKAATGADVWRGLHSEFRAMFFAWSFLRRDIAS